MIAVVSPASTGMPTATGGAFAGKAAGARRGDWARGRVAVHGPLDADVQVLTSEGRTLSVFIKRMPVMQQVGAPAAQLGVFEVHRAFEEAWNKAARPAGEAGNVAATHAERVRATPAPKPSGVSRTVWQVLAELSGSIDGAEDWASDLDHYLYGRPHRGS